MRDLTTVFIYRHARSFAVMSTFISPARPKIVYPDSDGQPMSDNTLQFKWIVTIEGGLDARFIDAGKTGWRNWPVEWQDAKSTAVRALDAGDPGIAFQLFLQWQADKGLEDAQAAAKASGSARSPTVLLAPPAGSAAPQPPQGRRTRTSNSEA